MFLSFSCYIQDSYLFHCIFAFVWTRSFDFFELVIDKDGQCSERATCIFTLRYKAVQGSRMQECESEFEGEEQTCEGKWAKMRGSENARKRYCVRARGQRSGQVSESARKWGWSRSFALAIQKILTRHEIESQLQ